MSVQMGGLELLLGPQGLGAPDDLDAAIRAFIDDSRHELLVAVQELDSEPIARSIIAARARGVRVRIILEGDYLREEKPATDPWAPGGPTEANRTIHAALLRSGIDVITDLNPALFHQKFIVRDLGESTAAVLTGSANFTATDTGTNTITGGRDGGNNLNSVLILEGASAAGQFAIEFQRMRAGTFGELRERREPKPREFTLGRVRVKPLFAPRHGPEMEIMKQMLKAQEQIDFAMFTFARSSGIDDTMIRLADADLPIRGLLDRGQGSQRWASTGVLQQAGVELFHNRAGTGVRKIHHKLMVVDARLVIVGSFNYTAPATTLNDENLLVIGDLEEGNPKAEEGQREFAAHALAEIDRIVADLGEVIPVRVVDPADDGVVS